MAIIFTVASKEAARRRTKDKLCGRHSKKELPNPANKSNSSKITPCAESEVKPKDDHAPSLLNLENSGKERRQTRENE